MENNLNVNRNQISYHTLFNEMMEGFALHEIICDTNGKPVDYRFLTVNPAFEKMTGLSAADVVNRTVKEVLPQTEDSWIENYGIVALTGSPLRFEDYSIALDKFYQVVAYCPKIGQFATIIIDITERKITEEALLKSEEKYRLLIENQGEGVATVDLNEIFVFANPAADQMFGVQKGTLVGMSLLEFISPDQIPLIKAQSAKRALLEKSTYEIEIKSLTGERRHVLLTATPQTNSKGEISGTFGIFRDITDFIHAQKALEEKEARFRALFEGSPDAIILAVADTGIIIDANNAASRLTGKSRDKMVGMHHSKLHPHRLRGNLENTFFQHVLSASRNEESVPLENIILNADGTEIPVEIMANSFILNGKNVVQGVFRDIRERKNAEMELINSEVKYRELANSLPVCVFETDLEGILVFANATAMDWFGYSEAELYAGLNILQFVHESEREMARERFTHIITKSVNTTSEYNVKRKDNSLFPVIASVFAVSKNGVISGIRGTLADISERKMAEKNLRLSERNLSNLIKNLPGFVYRCKNDRDWTMEYLSEGFYAITGYSISDLIELKIVSYNDLIHPDYRESLWAKWQFCIDQGIPLEEEYPIITKGGQLRWVWERGRDVYNDEGNLLYLEGFISDITERKRIELVQKVLYDISTAVITTRNLEELIEIIRNQLGKLIDTSNFYVALFDEISGSLLTPHSVNQRDILESWPAERSITDYLIRQKKALLISEMELLDLIRTGEILDSGKPAKLWLGVPLLKDEKIFGAFVVQTYDNPNAFNMKDLEMLEYISRQIGLFILQKKSEGELQSALAKAEESNQLKSAFLAMMNHELRTPLTHILGFSELIMSGVAPEDNINFASSIQNSGQNLLSIIEGVFDLALVEHGKIKLTKQTFSLMDHFMENKASFDNILRTSARQKQIQLVYKPDPHWLASYVTADRSKINQILINLFKNAVKFTHEGTIEFGYRVENDSNLVYYIKDTGIGIPLEKQSIIFDFFRQGDDSYTRVYGGIGIGLSISRKIARLLKGELNVASVPGEGSIFSLTLPVELSYIK